MEKDYKIRSFKSKIIYFFLNLFCVNRKYKNAKNVEKLIAKNNTMSNKNYSPLKRDKNFSFPVYSLYGNVMNNKKNIIIYFHGGSYVEEAQNIQINYIVELAKKIDSELLMPIYKLVPNGDYLEFEKNLNEIYDIINKKFENIIFVGDSAGGALALSYTMSLKNNKKRMPDKLALFSPWLDISLSNNRITDIIDKDPICCYDGNLYCGKKWAKDISLTDWRVSPIYGDLNNLPPIIFTAGTFDLCGPDCDRFSEKLSSLNTKYIYLKFYNHVHNFELFPTKEGNIVLDEVTNFILDEGGNEC